MSFSMARDEQGCNGELQGRADPPQRQRSYLVSKYGLNLFCAPSRAIAQLYSIEE
jgi:hypothetical protein